MQVARVNFAATLLPTGQIFVSGGQKGANTTLNECEVLGQPSTTVPPMLHRRKAHSMIHYGSHIYAFGGQDEKGKLTASIERIAVNKQGQFGACWESVGQMPVACCNVGLAIDEHNNLLIIGGKTLQATLKAVHEFDIASGGAQSRQIATLQTADCFPSANPIISSGEGVPLIVGREAVHRLDNFEEFAKV